MDAMIMRSVYHSLSQGRERGREEGGERAVFFLFLSFFSFFVKLFLYIGVALWKSIEIFVIVRLS